MPTYRHNQMTEFGHRPGPYPSLLRVLCDLLAEAIPTGDEELPVLPKQSEVSPCST